MKSDKYQIVIGLEVHAQMSTKSKLFCADRTDFGAAPNSQVSVVSLAHPGTLPVLNEAAIELAIKLGLALDCEIPSENYFARKNYFYPDLPKGYQVSQHTAPICKGGFLSIPLGDQTKAIALNRIHIEEDAGKSIHDADEYYTFIDLNRATVPLLEIVTEPVMHSADEAFTFLTELRKLLRWLEVCDGNMEQGSMRCDANISVRLQGNEQLGTRVEIKNLNSIRNVKRAITLESTRLIALTEIGEKIIQETRSYDADTDTSFSLRSKETADDYRYFPEPDLPAVHISNELLQAIRNKLPILPMAMKQKCIDQYGLSDYDAMQVTSDRGDATFFENMASHTSHYKAIANWMMGPLKTYCNENNILIQHFPLHPKKLAALIDYTETTAINFNAATSKLLPALLNDPAASVIQLAESLNLIQNSDETVLLQWIEAMMLDMPDKVLEYRSGKKGLMGLFAGEIKKRSKGKADMKLTQILLQQKLNT